MTELRGLIALLISGIALLWAATTAAHEVRPAYLHIKEVSNGDGSAYFEVLWKQPAVQQGRLAIDPVFPSDCTMQDAGPPEITPSALLQRWTTDCALGLVCVDQKCTPLQFWSGATCEEDSGAFRAYFEIPRGQPLAEFYRLPFPNDILIKDGTVDVTGHPNPKLELPAGYGDVVGAYLKQISKDVTGWGLNTAILLRLSQGADLGKNPSSLTPSGDNPTVQFFNIDQSSPDAISSTGSLR